MDYVAELRPLVGTRPLILPGTSVLIVDDAHRLLLLERSDISGWGLPGGFLEPGESLEDAGRREVYEEIGVTLRELWLFGVFSGPGYFFRYPNGDQVHNVTAAYVAAFPPGAMMTLRSNEISRAVFFEMDAVPSNIIGPERPIVDAFLAQTPVAPPSGNEPLIRARTHD